MPAFLEEKLDKGHSDDQKHHVASKMGYKKLMVKKELAKNRENPRHGFRHELMQGASKKYLAGMAKAAEENAWRYARLNAMSDKRIF